jgi:hypothetical protein
MVPGTSRYALARVPGGPGKTRALPGEPVLLLPVTAATSLTRQFLYQETGYEMTSISGYPLDRPIAMLVRKISHTIPGC